MINFNKVLSVVLSSIILCIIIFVLYTTIKRASWPMAFFALFIIIWGGDRIVTLVNIYKKEIKNEKNKTS